MMDVDAVGSDFEEPASDQAPPKKKPAAKTKKAPVKAPAKKAPTKGRGKKAVVVGSFYIIPSQFAYPDDVLKSDSDDDVEVIELDEDEEEDEPPKTTKRTNRAAVLR